MRGEEEEEEGGCGVMRQKRRQIRRKGNIQNSESKGDAQQHKGNTTRIKLTLRGGLNRESP